MTYYDVLWRVINNGLRDDILSTMNYELVSGTFSSKTLDFFSFFNFFIEKCVSDAAKWLKIRTFVG